MTVTISPGYDIRLNDGTTDLQFRLVLQDGLKAWSVDELPPNPRIFSDLQSGEGFSPLQDLPFIMNDWFMGVGVDRFGPDFSAPGQVLRYQSGDGIDTSEPGIVKHGPLLTEIGTLNADPIKFVLFDDKVWIATDDGLYHWDGTTLVLFWDSSAESTPEVIRDIEVFGTNLFITLDRTDKYRFTDGTAGTPTLKDFTNSGIASGTMNKLTVVVRAIGDVFKSSLVATLNNNQITWNDDPTDDTGTATVPSWVEALDISESGIDITNLSVLSGLLLVATENTLYIVDDEDRVIELDIRLRTQKSTTAFSLKAESGSEIWLGDSNSTDIIRLVSKGFDEFDIQPEGPQFSRLERPVKFDLISGLTKGLALDLENVYVGKVRVGNTDIYKGREIGRAFFTWSPIATLAEQITTMSVIKRSSDTYPLLYIGTTSDKVHTMPTKDWTAYVSSWELVTPFFNAKLESMDKLWHTLEAFLEVDTNAKLDITYRTKPSDSFVTFGSVGTMSTDGANRILHTTAIAGKAIQLKFVGSTTDSADKVHMRSFNLTGVLRPPLKRVFSFTLVADTKAERTFMYTMRTKTDAFVTLTDRFGDKHTVFIVPGFPKEIELVDEVRKTPFRAYQVVAYAVDTAAI